MEEGRGWDVRQDEEVRGCLKSLMSRRMTLVGRREEILEMNRRVLAKGTLQMWNLKMLVQAKRVISMRGKEILERKRMAIGLEMLRILSRGKRTLGLRDILVIERHHDIED